MASTPSCLTPIRLTMVWRPTIGIKRDQVLQLNERFGLHPALDLLMPMWSKGELAAVTGLGYPQPNLSHFRSIEIWGHRVERKRLSGRGLAHARLRRRRATEVLRR